MSLNIIYHSTGDTVESDTDAMLLIKDMELEHVDTLENPETNLPQVLLLQYVSIQT